MFQLRLYELISRKNFHHSFLCEIRRDLTKKLAFSFSDHIIAHISRKCQSFVIYYLYYSGNTNFALLSLKLRYLSKEFVVVFAKPF